MVASDHAIAQSLFHLIVKNIKLDSDHCASSAGLPILRIGIEESIPLFDNFRPEPLLMHLKER